MHTARTVFNVVVRKVILMKRPHPYRLKYRVTDLNHSNHDVVKALLEENNLAYDQVLIETKSGIAYVYQYRHPYRVYYEQ